MNEKRKVVIIFLIGLALGFVIGFTAGVDITVRTGLEIAQKLLDVKFNPEALALLNSHFSELGRYLVEGQA